MRISRLKLPALAGFALLSLFLLAYALVVASAAKAAGPATVTVRVIGSNVQPLLPLTQVTTTTTPVVKDGKPEDSCTGTSVAGALELATKGSWDGAWDSSFGYGVETIEGVSYPFTQPDYWTLWLDNKSSEVGVCGAELNSGDSVLFFVECFSKTTGVCPPTPPNVLAIEAPANVEVNKPVTVTVLSYPNSGGEPPKPVMGAIVVGGGDASALHTNAQGQTTLIFLVDGRYTIDATAAAGGGQSSIPGEAFVCAHQGNDGTCGTQAPSSSSGVKLPASGGTIIDSGPATVEKAKIAGVKNGHVYSRRTAPRLLKGSVVVPAGGLLRKVQISLKRRYRGRCFDFSGSRGRFVAVKCKQAASFFSVGTKDSFSYLLPARLPRGLYTYDIEAVDGTGHTTKLVSGISHVVFKVK
jgi:hypothetical protein